MTWSGHYEGIQPLITEGKLVDGGEFNAKQISWHYSTSEDLAKWLVISIGAIFSEHPQEGKDAQFLGSVVVYTGESTEAVRSIIENDVYATSGVWDLAKAQIIPVSLTLLQVSCGYGTNTTDSMFRQWGKHCRREKRNNIKTRGWCVWCGGASGSARRHPQTEISTTKKKEKTHIKESR